MSGANQIRAKRAEDIAKYMALKHHEPIWMDPGILVATGIQERVTEMLTRSGWSGLLTLSHPADKEDTAEFLATVKFIDTEEEKALTFFHRGRERRVTADQIRAIFGWPDVSEPVLMCYDGHRMWRALSTYPYEAGKVRAKALTDATMFYMHHLMSKTLLAKKHADRVGIWDLGVLFRLHEGTVPDWCWYFCHHVSNSLRGNSPVCCGGMVTYLLRSLYGPSVPRSHTILHCMFADTVWFQCGQTVQVHSDGRVEWKHSLDPARRPPPPARRGRPPSQPRAQVSTEHGESSREHGESSAQPPLTSRQIEEYARAHIDHMFHLMRTSFLYPQEITRVPAPPGWQPGFPIPPEYLQPHPPGY